MIRKLGFALQAELRNNDYDKLGMLANISNIFVTRYCTKS